MRAKVVATFIGGVDSSFKNDKGEEIRYKQAMFAVLGEMEAPVFSIPEKLDISSLRPGETAYMVVEFRYQAQYKNFKARVEAIYPTQFDLDQADVSSSGHVEPGTYAASFESGKKK